MKAFILSSRSYKYIYSPTQAATTVDLRSDASASVNILFSPQEKSISRIAYPETFSLLRVYNEERYVKIIP